MLIFGFIFKNQLSKNSVFESENVIVTEDSKDFDKLAKSPVAAACAQPERRHGLTKGTRGTEVLAKRGEGTRPLQAGETVPFYGTAG